MIDTPEVRAEPALRRSSPSSLAGVLIVLLLASPFAGALLGLAVRLFRLTAGV